MGEEIAFENGRISDFEALVTLTLNRVILHAIMHQSSTSTYIPSFCGRTDGRTFETHFIRSTRRSRPNSNNDEHFMTITACTVVQAVVKATSQSNGKGQILTPWGSETHERISMKLGIYNRAAGMTTHANPCGAATTWVVWANT